MPSYVYTAPLPVCIPLYDEYSACKQNHPSSRLTALIDTVCEHRNAFQTHRLRPVHSRGCWCSRGRNAYSTACCSTSVLLHPPAAQHDANHTASRSSRCCISRVTSPLQSALQSGEQRTRRRTQESRKDMSYKRTCKQLRTLIGLLWAN